MNIIIEAILVSIVTFINGLIIEQILNFFNIKNKSILLLSLGFFVHLFFEYIGLNKIYCKYGNACKL